MRSWKIFGTSRSASSDDGGASGDEGGGSGAVSRQFGSEAPHSAPAFTSRGAGAPAEAHGGAGFMGFMSSRTSQEARMERSVSLAARNLGDGVQKIVLAAKGKQQQQQQQGGSVGSSGSVHSGGSGSGSGSGSGGGGGEWKTELLKLLGGGSGGTPKGSNSGGGPGGGGGRRQFKEEFQSDLDVLLENSNCEHFVLRCVENELPPNLIHCLRLLRVLELQHANEAPPEQVDLEPVGRRAAAKVSRLLVRLCADSSVGEQLRPHLFGLLALSGASYPPSGVHVATAASTVITAFAESCLSRPLVWFIHDRKMVLHMTDDIKELCGIAEVAGSGGVGAGSGAAPEVPRGLEGLDAERAGLWAIALRTVTHLIHKSTRHGSLELVRDFEAAGGYDAFRFAIRHSTRPHGKEIMELLPVLACCPTTESNNNGISDLDVLAAADPDAATGGDNVDVYGALTSSSSDSKLATNMRVFEILGELLQLSNPLLKEFRRRNPDRRPYPGREGVLSELASLSIETAVQVRDGTGDEKTRSSGKKDDVDENFEFGFDVASELLGITLQLFSDHPDNYYTLEGRQFILTFYLLALPCFHDADLKNFILKTLEFVLTGVIGVGGGSDDNATPMNACSEIFFALCHALFRGTARVGGSDTEPQTAEATEGIPVLFKDADLVGGTLEKLLQFDQRVAPLMVESGMLTTNLNALLEVVADYVGDSSQKNAEEEPPARSQDDSKEEQEDGPLQAPPASTPLDGTFQIVARVLKLLVAHQPVNFSKDSSRKGDQGESTNLHTMLRMGATDLGTEACRAAAGVFEAYMSSFASLVGLRQDMRFVLGMLDRLAVLTKQQQQQQQQRQQEKNNNDDHHHHQKDRGDDGSLLEREAILLSMLRSVLEARSLAREAFRDCDGFDVILRVLLALRDTVQESSSVDRPNFTAALMKLLSAIVGLLDAAVGNKSRNPMAGVSEVSTLTLSPDYVVDFVSSQIASPSPASLNRHYLRQRRFYLDLAAAAAGTGLLRTSCAGDVMDLALSHADPSLKPLAKAKDRCGGIRHPDAVRFALGLAAYMPGDLPLGRSLSKQVMDCLAHLCEPDRVGSTLPQMASCGVSWSLTDPNEFAPILLDRRHQMHSGLVTLLGRLAANSMSYRDFISVLRCLTGPLMLRSEIGAGAAAAVTAVASADPHRGRVKLPVISSSLGHTTTTTAATAADSLTTTTSSSPTAGASFVKSPSLSFSEEQQQQQDQREEDICHCLETLCEIATNAARYPRMRLGGDSINTIAVLMHAVKLEDRLRGASEEGRLKYLEIEKIDASAASAADAGAVDTASSAAAEVWAPLAGAGFTYSLWMRHEVAPGTGVSGNFYILDIFSSPPPSSSSPSSQGQSDGNGGSNSGQGFAFLSVWYDILNQRFNVMSSSSFRAEPTCFPVSPLLPHVWHHVLVTYTPAPKRSMMSGRKSVFSIFVDGRPLEVEVRVDSVNLPPTSRVVVGAPNPALAVSGVVRGLLPLWECGPMAMLSTVLLDLDATAIYSYGPDFPGLLWGDRPQRLSLAATGTSLFAMLADTGEAGSVASALRRRDIPKLEAAGYSTLGHTDKDHLSTMTLLCSIPADCVVFGFQAATVAGKARNAGSSSSSYKTDRRLVTERLVNLARLNYANDAVSTDAVVYGRCSVMAPVSFADCLQWAGGPNLLMPLANAATSTRTLASALQIIRESCRRHVPNLEMMQAGGGYRVLAVLLKDRVVDERSLDQCLAFALHGFDDFIAGGRREAQQRQAPERARSRGKNSPPGTPSAPSSGVKLSSPAANPFPGNWVLCDLDAMKHLLLNHQVWDLRKYGPDLPLRLLTALNRLVEKHSIHKAFNARRLHLVGIVRWALHLMIEAAELFSAGGGDHSGGTGVGAKSGSGSGAWSCEAPLVSDVSVGGDPGNPFLQECKNLLRRVLTFMLTPGDLEALSEAIVYTTSIGTPGGASRAKQQQPPPTPHHGVGNNSDSGAGGGDGDRDDRMLPGATMRLYLVRLLEELIVDGVNEIVSSGSPASTAAVMKDAGTPRDGSASQPHAGGVASPNQPYLSLPATRGVMADGGYHPKHQQAQSFLSAFAGFLNPVWFATVLEGCREEASASAVLRLMILLSQGSSTFESALEASGGFAPFVLSIPRFSTCPGITMSLLSQLLQVPILHLHSLPSLDPEQLCEVFDSECDNTSSEMLLEQIPSDPSCGIFALLAECLGRNIQLISSGNDPDQKARETNQAVFQLLSHRHTVSATFQAYCCTPAFLEPLSQALCLVYDERLQQARTLRSRRRSGLGDVPRNLTPTERFVGGPNEAESSGGLGMVRLLRMVILRTVTAGPGGALVIRAIFGSFPIHASPQQVEAFHLVLIEHCRSVVEEVLEDCDGVTIGNCIGVCSVLLDEELQGFLTSEAALESVKMVIAILICLTRLESRSSRTLNTPEHSLLTIDAAHMANLLCVAALRISRPLSAYDHGDDDLQSAVLEAMDANIDSLLLVAGQRNQKSGAALTIPSGPVQRPTPTSRLFPLWQSSSIARFSGAGAGAGTSQQQLHQQQRPVLYPDLCDSENPELSVLAPLVVILHGLLMAPREDVRSLAINVFVALLQYRPNVMSGLLVAEVQYDGYTETIDVVNRGGFRALLAAHEAASLGDGSGAAAGVSVKRKYASFYEWFERNQNNVQVVVDSVNQMAFRLFPGLERISSSQEEAVEKEQKLMLMRLTTQGSSDRTILGGLERAELARRCCEKTSDNHGQWRRQGFDDLAFGAMKWKVLLRQLKGSYSIWEGGYLVGGEASVPLELSARLFALERARGRRIATVSPSMDNVQEDSLELVKRWKLDLSEGHERQRRRLLPNYEFHGLYNLDESAEQEMAASTAANSGKDNGASEIPPVTSSVEQGATTGGGTTSEFLGGEMEATAELLKDLNLKRAHNTEQEEYEYDDTEAEDGQTVASTATGGSSVANDAGSVATQEEAADAGDPSAAAAATNSSSGIKPATNETRNEATPEEKPPKNENENEAAEAGKDENEDSSSYELITGLLQAGDWPEKSYNVRRCTGLEVTKALLLWCSDAIYVIDGFEQTGDGMEGKITRVEREQSRFNISLRPKDFKLQKEEKTDEELAEAADERSTATRSRNKQASRARSSSTEAAAAVVAESPVIYRHRSQRIAFSELYSVFRRRYQLQQNALEFIDVQRTTTFIAFDNNEVREVILSKVLQSKLPNSIFSSSYGQFISYSKFMSNLKAKIVSQWVTGKMTNFDFLMHLNSFAGRSFNDLTQYPVFPWVIADYESEEIDLTNPKTYRDLSKPMGAIGEERAQQFRDRYEALASTCFSDDDPPPFHYGTHYSCAAYVLYYLMRLEPFSRLALALQGGRFDVADRLFHDVGRSWKSASADNLQDVRELIPEFFYLPDFLMNTNNFDFGETQRGKTVHDVSLPKWAKGDPQLFVRINRQALESPYVSQNLHHWIDLIFGFKQRGQEAIDNLNTFVHVTYEGQVDLDAMTDPIQRASTIAQIQNFGQTPSRLERKPFPQRLAPVAVRDRTIDFGALPSLTALAPPFCVVGAHHRVQLRPTQTETCRLGVSSQSDKSVGDLCLAKGQLIGVGRLCTLIVPSKKYYRFGGLNNGISVHTAALSTRYREVNKLLSIHDALHRAPISVAKASLNGEWLVTGCVDSTIRVWRYDGNNLELRSTLCGHDGFPIRCLDVSTECGVLVSGCAGGKVLLWDLRTLTFVRGLHHCPVATAEEEAAVSVSINHKNGNVVTLVGCQLSIFDINGNLLARNEVSPYNHATCAVATDCPEWMEMGITCITGHVNGEVRLLSLDYEKREFAMRHLLDDNPHTNAITVLRVTGTERQDTLLVGDSSGKMTVCKTVQLDSYSPAELAEVVSELESIALQDRLAAAPDAPSSPGTTTTATPATAP